MSNRDKEFGHTYGLVPTEEAGLGPDSAGQSGDIQGLSNVASADSESIVELLEEGQSFEAEAVGGIEASDGEVKELRTAQFPENDVPEEYLEQD